MTVISIIVANGISAASSQGEMRELIDGKHWTVSVRIEDQANWRSGDRSIAISIPAEHRDPPYIPYDLSDAWRELDRMLPDTYAKFAADHGTDTACLSNADDKLSLLHNDLAQFLRDRWLGDGNTRLAKYFASLGDLGDPADDAPNSSYRDWALTTSTALILCNFYIWKKTGEFRDFPDLVADFRANLRSHRSN
jgi:hypothetical protein